MDQKQMDEFARLDFSEEQYQIKRLKRILNYGNVPADSNRRGAIRFTIRYHKLRKEYYKRQIPMKAVLEDDGLCDMYLCPTCRWAVSFLRPHCSECGQRIMW